MRGETNKQLQEGTKQWLLSSALLDIPHIKIIDSASDAMDVLRFADTQALQQVWVKTIAVSAWI